MQTQLSHVCGAMGLVGGGIDLCSIIHIIRYPMMLLETVACFFSRSQTADLFVVVSSFLVF